MVDVIFIFINQFEHVFSRDISIFKVNSSEMIRQPTIKKKNNIVNDYWG